MTDSRVTTLSRRIRYGLAFILGLAVAAVGDVTSFNNLRTYARQHDFPVDWGLPIGLDAGIPALLLLDSLRPSKFFRAIAWALSAGTVAANAAVTPDHSWIARGLHGIMPALAITWYEAVRHLNDSDDGMDRIRWTRYLVSPVRTVRLRFRMIRWELTSYSEALRLESAILLARAVLIAEYGRRDWRRTRRRVPVILRHQLDTGQLPAELFFASDWTVEVRLWVLRTLDELDPGRLAVPDEPEQSGPDPGRDPAELERDPWELMWVLRDRLIPDGVSPELFARAHAIARHHFEQVGQHITVKDLRPALGVQKARAGMLARLFRTAYETGPVLLLQERDAAPGPAEDLTDPGETPAETSGLLGPFAADLAGPGGLG